MSEDASFRNWWATGLPIPSAMERRERVERSNAGVAVQPLTGCCCGAWWHCSDSQKWWAGRDSNSHAEALVPKTSVSANSTTGPFGGSGVVRMDLQSSAFPNRPPIHIELSKNWRKVRDSNAHARRPWFSKPVGYRLPEPSRKRISDNNSVARMRGRGDWNRARNAALPPLPRWESKSCLLSSRSRTNHTTPLDCGVNSYVFSLRIQDTAWADSFVCPSQWSDSEIQLGAQLNHTGGDALYAAADGPKSRRPYVEVDGRRIRIEIVHQVEELRTEFERAPLLEAE
jgi:hypothetical protein